MSSVIIEIFEGYILSDNQESYIKSIAYNKEYYNFLRLTHDLKHHGLNLPEESKKILEKLEE